MVHAAAQFTEWVAKCVVKPARWHVLFVLCLVQLVFGIWALLAKAALSTVHPLVLTFYRDSGASAILLTLAYRVDGPIKITKDHKLLGIMGVCSLGNSVGFMAALTMVTIFNASLLHPAIPVFAAILSVWFGIEPFNRAKLLGMTLCIIGSASVVIYEGSSGHSSHPLLGNLLLVAHCISLACLLVTQKFALLSYPVHTLTAVYYTLGTILCALLTAIVVPSTTSDPAKAMTFSRGAEWLGLFFGIFVVTFNYICIGWCNKHSSPTIVGTSMMLQPLFTGILAFLFLGQETSVFEVIGGLVVIAGLVLTMFAPENLRLSLSDGYRIFEDRNVPSETENSVNTTAPDKSDHRDSLL